jgi:hypothetical protein
LGLLLLEVLGRDRLRSENDSLPPDIYEKQPVVDSKASMARTIPLELSSNSVVPRADTQRNKNGWSLGPCTSPDGGVLHAPDMPLTNLVPGTRTTRDSSSRNTLPYKTTGENSDISVLSMAGPHTHLCSNGLDLPDLGPLIRPIYTKATLKPKSDQYRPKSPPAHTIPCCLPTQTAKVTPTCSQIGLPTPLSPSSELESISVIKIPEISKTPLFPNTYPNLNRKPLSDLNLQSPKKHRASSPIAKATSHDPETIITIPKLEPFCYLRAKHLSKKVQKFPNSYGDYGQASVETSTPDEHDECIWSNFAEHFKEEVGMCKPPPPAP